MVTVQANTGVGFDPYAYVSDPAQIRIAKSIIQFFEAQSETPRFEIRTREDLASRKAEVREKLLHAVGLSPLPKRVPIDLRQSDPLEHPWCTIRKIHYQIWPGIYSEAFLYVPVDVGDQPVPAILSLTGHWPFGKAYADEQKRCLNFARLGYIVLAPDQNHYEDLPIGISHQTHMIWSNMRALDVLAEMSQVDAKRIGACGGSGGGFQAQMLLALDDRLAAASIMGYTANYREILFPHVASCTCTHYPRASNIADQPEISAMGLPVPVQYLTMNDYTKNFTSNAFPTIEELYRNNGFPDHVECRHWPTEHVFDKPKREAAYRWMQKWLKHEETSVEEPETITYPIPRLLAMETGLPATELKLENLTTIYSTENRYHEADINDKAQWSTYRNSQVQALDALLGMDRRVPVASQDDVSETVDHAEGLLFEKIELPVEGAFRIPVTIIRPEKGGPFHPVILCSGDGRKKLLDEKGPASAIELARAGRMVVIPDLRFFGEIDLDHLIGVGPTSLMTFTPSFSQDEWLRNQDYTFHYHVDRAWQRNSIVWGRPLCGMIVTDIREIVGHMENRSDADLSRLEIVGRASKEDADYSVPLSVLFAVAVDSRLKRTDVDLGGKSFTERTLPAIPFILWHGDVPQWAACLADRSLTLRNLSRKAGGAEWLKSTFAHAGGEENLNLTVTEP